MDVTSAWTRWKRWIITATVIVLFYTLFGFFALPAIVSSVLPDKLEEVLKREVGLGKVRVNPYALSITLEDLRVSDAEGSPFAGFRRLYVNLQLSSLLRWAAVLREVRLEGFEATVVRTGERRFNFSDLIPEAGTQPRSDDAEGKKPFRFAVQDLQISGARVAFEDRFAGSRHRIEGLDLKAVDLSSLPEGTGKEVSADLSATVDGASVSITAKAMPFAADRSAAATVSVENLAIPRYLVYLPTKPAAVIDTALLGVSLQVAFLQPPEGKRSLVVSGPVRLSTVKILDRRGRTMIQTPEIAVVLEKSDLLAPALTVGEARITRPEVLVVRDREGALNLLDLVPLSPSSGSEKTSQAPPEAAAPGISLLVKQAIASGGSARFVDEAVAGGFETTLSGIEFSAAQFSLDPENSATVRLAFTTDADESAAVDGTFSLFPVRTAGAFTIDEIDLARYVPYAADLLKFELRSGRLSLGGRFAVAAGGPSPKIDVEEGKAALRELVLYHPEDQVRVVSIPTLDVSGVSFSSVGRRLSVGEVTSGKGEVFYLHRRDGTINLAGLVALPEKDAAPGEKGRPAATAEGGGAAVEPPGPMQVSVDRVRIEDYRVRIEDRRPTETVSGDVSDIRIALDGLSNARGSAAKVGLSFKGSRGGSADLKGTLGINPVTADLQVDVNRFDIRAYQPYFTDRVKIIVTGGTLSVGGRFQLDASDPGTPQIRYTGNAEVNGFKSVDKEDTLEFIDWESLYLSDMDVRLPPASVSVKEVGLTGLYSRVIIDKDGTVNVIDAVSGGPEKEPALSAAQKAEARAQTKDSKGEAPSAPKEPGAGGAPSIQIGAVTLQNSHINFTDLFNPFNFKGDLTEIGGRVSGLSSIETDRADVLLNGSWEKRAPLEIKGKINPLAENRFADVTLTIRDIDLSPFSPYSGKFLGYKLEKGLLTLELGYLLKGTHLKGDNRAYFEELTLGDRVDSEDATSLPVALAISLLKDPSGTITLDVPVEGDLDDPQFSLGRTVLQVIGNLLVKIISSPFAFLGNLAGQQEELSFVDFEAGSVDITAAAAEKLDALTTALAERPALQLEIRGDADPKADPEALRQRKFEDLVRSQKLRDLTRRGETAVPLEDIEISPEEYPRYLQKAYDAADFPKPRDADGRIKALSPEEMEKLLMTQFIFTENDLRQLAVERADAVKSRMLETGRVGSDRLFIVEPKILTAAEGKGTEETGKSQVKFSLR
ncbi:MAG: DUF748 domain-containing protein [Desulfobacterales bacterium]|jgi:hypothetical protein